MTTPTPYHCPGVIHNVAIPRAAGQSGDGGTLTWPELLALRVQLSSCHSTNYTELTPHHLTASSYLRGEGR